MAKNLVFPRTLFVRHPERDFSDDGSYFRCYYYKDALPITVCTYQGDAYADMRLDYLGFRYEVYREDYSTLDMCNGVSKETFPMDKFVAACEEIYQKYIADGAELRAKNEELIDAYARKAKAKNEFRHSMVAELSVVISDCGLDEEEAIECIGFAYYGWEFDRTETRPDGTVVAIFKK